MKDVCQCSRPYSLNELETDTDWLTKRLGYLWWLRDNDINYFLDKGFGNEKDDIYFHNLIDNDFIDKAHVFLRKLQRRTFKV